MASEIVFRPSKIIDNFLVDILIGAHYVKDWFLSNFLL